MRRYFGFGILLVVAICMSLGGCGKGSSYSAPTAPAGTPPTTSQPNVVLISGMAFGPSPVTVAKGTSVTWQNKDNEAHTATADDGSWGTGIIGPGGSKSVSFANAGTFTYHCTIHPEMRAKVVVQ